MNKLHSVAAALAGLLSLPSGAQDMAVMQKWAAAKVIKYRVEGVHKARASVAHGDYVAKADVTDRMTVEFTWDARKRSIVEPVTVVDSWRRESPPPSASPSPA